jgi:6-phosphogluconate dehydrogenase
MSSDALDGRSLGLIGLGTMGANFARNLAGKGARLVLFDADNARATALATELGARAVAVADLAAAIRALPRPRGVFMLVPAGAPVDATLEALRPWLEPGDAVIDGGNSFWRDTERRSRLFTEHGIEVLGFGVSGGAEGARTGPAIMAGGATEAVTRLAPLFRAVAAQHDGVPCFVACGPGGAGHFVKMVHNGIEYAVMQMIAEAYVLLRDHHGLDADAIGGVFRSWRDGAAGSFLLDCAVRALAARDGESPLIDAISDTASQKGTGSWAAIAALELGVPAPSLAEAVFARTLSALRTERLAAAAAGGSGPASATDAVAGDTGAGVTVDDLAQALIAASISVHAQGFALMAAAAREHGWADDLAAIAAAWRSGCIIRSRLMEDITRSLANDPHVPNILRIPLLAQSLASRDGAWRRVVSAAARAATPAPALASALAYVDGYRQRRSGAHLIAAQRDVFGRHGFQRLDRPGTFHAEWPAP